MKLTQSYIRQEMYYNTQTGLCYWIKQKSGRVLNKPVGTLNKNTGYIVLKIDYVLYPITKLIWLYMKGYFPENDIDHIDRIRHNNKWENLRHVSRQCNRRNSCVRYDNKSGITGVSINKYGLWDAQIAVNYKRIRIGQYKSFDEAVCARLAMEQCLNWNGCDSNSSAYQYVKDNIL